MNPAVRNQEDGLAPTELEVVLRAQGGDDGAFEVLANKYRPYIINLCRTRNISYQDACDIANAVLYSIWKNIQTFDSAKANSPEPFRTWVTAIALNATKSFLRKNRPEVLMSELGQVEQDRLDKAACESSPLQQVMLKELNDHLAQDSPATAEIVRLKYIYGFNTNEIAQTFGITIAAVGQRICRARRLVKQLAANGPRSLRLNSVKRTQQQNTRQKRKPKQKRSSLRSHVRV